MPQPYRLRFVEEAATVKELMEKEYERIAPNIEAPGFRKGHVPRNVAEKQKFFNKFDAYRGIFDMLYLKAIEEQNLEVIQANDFEVMGPFEETSPLVIQCTLLLKPKVLDFDLASITVPKVQTAITDELINDQISALQKSMAKYTNVTDENYQVKTGDMLIIDYVGRVNGKEFQGGTAKFFKYFVGQTHFINGFEQQLVNIKPGQTAIIKVTFPEGYHAADLKGKDAEFTTTVHKIETCELKPVETIAQEKSMTVEQLVESIRQKLTEDYTKVDQDNFQTEVLTACINNCEMEPIPERMIEWELDSEWNKLLYRISMTEGEYLKKDPNAKDSFYAQKRRHAEKTVEVKIFLDFICNKFDITVTRDEVIDYLKSQGEKLQKSTEEMEAIMKNIEKQNNYRATESSVKHDKVIEILLKEVEKNNAEKDKA